MSIQNYLQHLGRGTPQTGPISGTSRNSAGGFSFLVDAWTRLDRFLVLGSEGGSYYATERALTMDNAHAVLECLALDGPRTVRRIVEISESGRAPKNDAAILALAMALKLGQDATRAAAEAAVPKVARTGTHLFQLADAVKTIGGWGRRTRRAFGGWYLGRDSKDLARQLVKYQQREGWAHRDVLRKAHPQASGVTNELLAWSVKGWGELGAMPEDEGLKLVWAFEKAKRATSAKEIVSLVRDHALPREAVPTAFLNDKDVWAALLDNGGRGMPMAAMVRNLAKMTVVGLLKPNADATRQVARTLVDADILRKSRLHPMALLVALRTYAEGRGERGKLAWTPVPEIVRALEDGFHAAFPNAPSSGKRWLLALDVSGSMGTGRVANSSLTPRDASAAMALVTLAREERAHVVGFTGPAGLSPLRLDARLSLREAIDRVTGLPFGPTDCAMPMKHALAANLAVDTFVVYTDSETWAGRPHPVEALREYRQRTGIPAKLVVVGMVSNGFTIADPRDAGMLDVVGFDTATPALIADFAQA